MGVGLLDFSVTSEVRSWPLVVLVIVCAFLVACGDDPEQTDTESPTADPSSSTLVPTLTARAQTSLELPVRIAVTLPVFEDFVRMAGGDHADVFSLVPEGVDPQTYELTRQDIARLQGVKLFYLNGLGLDEHLQAVIEANRDERSYVIPFAPNVRSPTVQGVYADEAQDEAHLWLDPDVAAIYVAIIADEFVIYDEVNLDLYDERFREARSALKDFALELAEELQPLSNDRRKLVAYSDAVTHLARRFDMELVATASGGGDNETPDETVQRLIQVVEDEAVPAVFAEYGHDDSIMQSVASETGAELCVLYTDIADESPVEYEELMRANVAELMRCLDQ